MADYTIDFRNLFLAMVKTSTHLGLIKADQDCFERHPSWFEHQEGAQQWLTGPRTDTWFVTVSHYVSGIVGYFSLSQTYRDQGAYISSYNVFGGGNHDQTTGEMMCTLQMAHLRGMNEIEPIGKAYRAWQDLEIHFRNWNERNCDAAARGRLVDGIDAAQETFQAKVDKCTFPLVSHTKTAEQVELAS